LYLSKYTTMINEFIIDYAKMAILVLVLLFIIIKFAIIKVYGFREQQFHLFIVSMNLFSRAVIENTYSEELQGYYRVSNKLNLFFYIVAMLLVAAYVLFKFYL